MRPSIFAAILAICLSGQAAAKDLSDDDADLAIQKASQFLNSGDPAHAVQAVEPIISELERRAKGDRVVYCGSTQAAILATMATAASQNKSAVAYPLAWCSALFVKGFALIDLHRAAEAEPFLRRATEFAPYEAHFANEYAEWFKSARRWDEAFAKFQHAFDIAGLADEAAQPALKARALRGMSFTRSELGKFDEAEKFLRRSMEFEPDNPAARHELEYIAEQRGKPKT